MLAKRKKNQKTVGRPRPRRFARAMASVFFLSGWLLSLLLFSVIVMTEGREDIRQVDALFVPGCLVNEAGKPSYTLQKRVDRAAELYHGGYAPLIIVSGGQGGDEPVPEAEAMAQALKKLGVPDSAISIEDESTSTRENVRNSVPIIEENGIESIMVVTSEFHIFRTVLTMRQEGIDNVAYAVAPSYQKRIWSMRLREVLSLAKCMIGA